MPDLADQNQREDPYQPDFASPYTGTGHDLREITRSGLEIRPIPLSAGIHGDDAFWEYEHVFSPFSRLYYARHGKLSIESGGRRIFVPREGFLVIPAQLHFNCRAEGRTEHFWIHFDLEPPYLQEYSKPVAIEGNPANRAVAKLAWESVAGSGSPHVRVHRMKALLHLLFAEMNLATSSTIPVQLHRALNLVNRSAARIHSVAQLARLAGYSPEHLAHLFRRHMRQSPSAYLRQCRIRETARRLAYTDATIERIADDLGFANRHHLSRLFKNIMNESPAAFRKRLQRSGNTLPET